MLGWILNICYLTLLAAISPMLVWKAYSKGRYRVGWRHKLWGQLPVKGESSPLIWLHAVSVGEVLLLRPVISRLRELRPDCRLLISTTTETGHQVAIDKFPDCQHAYFPLDFTWSVKTALDRVRPDLMVLAELELWPNFLMELGRRNIPTILVNARLSERSLKGYRKARFLFRPLLGALRAVAAQSHEYAGRFLELGVDPDRVSVTGSIKFDGVQTNRLNVATGKLQRLFGITDDQRVLVAGSTQDPEERIVLQAFRTLKQEFSDLRLIIVPRHPERSSAVATLIQQAGYAVCRRSQTEKPASHDSTQSVGLLDTVGELGACWGLADLAFVGGSMTSRGGQNMIEPAAYGAAVCFGPNTWNFRHVVEMFVNEQAAEVVGDEAELTAFLRRMLRKPKLAAEMGSRGQQLVMAQSGATDRTVKIILDLLPTAKQSEARAA